MAVYTDVTDQDLSALISSYDIGEIVTCKGIAEGVENSNFLLATTSDMYILTLYEKRVNPEQLPFFLGLMEHLAEHGFESPVPIKNRAGKALSECAGRPSAIVSFLKGQWPRKPTVKHCTGLGTALGRMHVAGLNYRQTRTNDLSLSGWKNLFTQCAKQADAVVPGLEADMTTELVYLEAHWPNDLPYGLIHADAFPDNIFFLGDTFSGMIDYYFACTDLLAYDIAICLNAWCFELDGQFNITKARALLASYGAERRLSEAEMVALPLLCRGAAVRFLLTRLYDWINHAPGSLVTPKDPKEYLNKLRFHQSVRGPGEYGLIL